MSRRRNEKNNNNPFVFDAFDEENSDAHSLFIATETFGTASKTFHAKLEAHNMRQNMSLSR